MLLDTLWTVFRSDTTQGDQGLDRTTNKTNELLEKIKSTDEASKDAGASLKSMALGALGGLTAALSISGAIAGAFARADMIRTVQQTSDALGVAIEDVDAFGKAAEVMGGDAQGARDSLTDMAEKMGEALSDVDSGAAKAFKSLGISLKSTDGASKGAVEGILDLAGAVEGLDRSAAVFKIKELGITDNRTVEMILKGRQELERLLKVQKEQGVITKESAENARKLTEAMGSLRRGISSAGDSFLDGIIPALTKVIDWLGKGVSWMHENKDFVIGFFGAIAAVVTAVYLPAMLSAAAATIAATWPFIAIGVAIAAAAAAFALIYDDIMNFIDGNDSFIGQVFEKYPMVEKVVMTIIEAFKQMFEILITGAQQIGEFVAAGFMQVVSGIKFAVDYLSEAYDAIAGFVSRSINVFQSLADSVAAIFSFIVDTVKGSLSFVTAGIDKIKSGVQGVAGFLGLGESGEGDGKPGSDKGTAADLGGSPDVPLAMKSARSQLAAASSAPSNGVSSSAISNSSRVSSETNVQVGQVTVQTQATDAQGMAAGATSELQSQLKNLEHESATGVDR